MIGLTCDAVNKKTYHPVVMRRWSQAVRDVTLILGVDCTVVSLMIGQFPAPS